MLRWALVAVLCSPVGASADSHDHAGHGDDHAEHAVDATDDAHAGHGAHAHNGHVLLGGMHDHESSAVSVGVLAASYRSPLYEGNYQGLVIGGRWAHRRFGVSLAQAVYRLAKNGRAEYGLGDLALHVHATALQRGDLAVGAMVMGSAPVGADREGFGMGHVMLMPEVWATYTPPSVAVAVHAGYAYMFGGASAHAEHGAAMWPLVDPMYAAEITFGATAMVPVAEALGIGARVAAARAVGKSLDAVEHAGIEADAWRVATGGRTVWIAGAWITTFEVLAGVASEPFRFRGMLETARRF